MDHVLIDVLRGGFNRKPKSWNSWWILAWVVTTPAWIVVNLLSTSWWWRIGTIVVLFGVQEVVSMWKRSDDLPPLTHAIRHFAPNWLAFPGVYAVVGSVGTRWMGFDLSVAWRAGIVAAVLGWMTDHFTLTYQGPDPYPFERVRDSTKQQGRPRIPL